MTLLCPPPGARRQPHRFVVRALLLVVPTLVGMLACRDLSGLAGTQALPSGTPNPSVYHTAAGALALYQSALAAAQGYNGGQLTEGAFVDVVFHSGLLSDELKAGDLGCSGGECTPTPTDFEDARQLPEGKSNPTDQLYAHLQQVRGFANEAIGALAAYDDSAPPALRGHLYALQGYAELYLADIFCSGVPLSTLNFNSPTSYSYAAGSPTTDVYRDAIAKFDTALTLSTDSVRIETLARMGKGRAFLALGLYDSAAVAVASVTQEQKYSVNAIWYDEENPQIPTRVSGSGLEVSEADEKGGNGLPFLTSGDPRTAAQVRGLNIYGVPIEFASKYGGATLSVAPLTVADGIEARLIQAEAALHGVATGHGSWLEQLNVLRQTAITPALPALTDPGPSPGDSARVSLLFQERAYWLYLTGHRLGDLRRLIRVYGRSAGDVFPTGGYGALGLFFSSTYLTAPIPPDEHENPKFTGCLSRGA